MKIASYYLSTRGE